MTAEPIPVLTLWQPWAQLCIEINPATGLPWKTIETRGWPAPKNLIGKRIALHAAARKPDQVSIGAFDCEPWFDSVRHVEDCFCEEDGVAPACARRSASRPVLTRTGIYGSVPFPLGAIIGSGFMEQTVDKYVESL